MDTPIGTYMLHFLQFDNGTPIQIAEPDQFDAANFVTKQDKDRLGRDVSFASGTVELSFNPLTEINGLHHHFDKIIKQYKDNGFEADIKYILRVSQSDSNYQDFVIGQLDFGEPETDTLTFFNCKVIQENVQAVVKRRMDTKINLFGTETLDGETIDPLVPELILQRAVPIFQESVLTTPNKAYPVFIEDQGRDYYHNPFFVLDRSEIGDTYSPYPATGNVFDFDAEDFVIIEAADKLVDFQFNIENLNIQYNVFDTDDIVLRMYYQVGTSFDFNSAELFFEEQVQGNEFILNNYNYQSPKFTINRNEKLYVIFDLRLTELPGTDDHFLSYFTTSGSLNASSKSISLSSTISGIKYIDAVRQVLKNISGLTLNAPQFETGKELNPQYLYNGLLLRNITDEPFNISLKELIEQLSSEWNGDYEIEDNNVFFIGLYDEFYKDKSMGTFTQVPNEEYREPINAKFAIKDFDFKYKKYEKSNDEKKSREGVHTAVETILPNKFADNSKKVDVPFIRDSFLIEKTRKDAIKISDDTATENDEDIFITDVITKSVSFSETFQVNHVVVSSTVLSLINDGTFNWELLGIAVNDFITITGQNAGDWLITGVTPKVLELSAVGPSRATYSGLELITMDYGVSTTNLTNRTNEGFTFILSTSNPEGFSNLRFTPKRNIQKYWGDYLGTATMYHREFGDEIKITEFIHNGELSSRRDDEIFTVTENAALGTKFLPRTLEPKDIETVVYCTFVQYRQLADKIRKERGYVEIQQPNGDIKKVHPTLLDYDVESDTMIINGNKRFEG